MRVSKSNLSREGADREYYRVVGLGRSRSRRYTTITLSFVAASSGHVQNAHKDAWGIKGWGQTFFSGRARGVTARASRPDTLLFTV